MRVLITGVAGFIGFSLANKLSEYKELEIVGIDNLNDYYDVALKKARLKHLGNKITFYKKDLNSNLDKIFKKYSFDVVINLAAQAGVRYSLTNPDAYMHSNVNGFYNLIRTATKFNIKKFIYASSSSIYGSNTKIPFSEKDVVNTPMSLYAASKSFNEAIASSFFYSFGIRVIGLRFFNIYGPWGRPDGAYFIFLNNLLNNKPISLNNKGEMFRDMTFIDDCVECIRRLINDDNQEEVPEIYNIGNKQPVKVLDLLEYLEEISNIKGDIIFSKRQKYEPLKTFANTDLIENKIQYSPNTNFKIGIKKFTKWYKTTYNFQ